MLLLSPHLLVHQINSGIEIVPVVAKSTMLSRTSSPRAQPSIWLETFEGTLHEVGREITTLCRSLGVHVQNNRGMSKESPIILPKEVSPRSLELILNYCRFHHAVVGGSGMESFLELRIAARSMGFEPFLDHGILHEELIPDELGETSVLPPVLPDVHTEDDEKTLIQWLLAQKRRKLLERRRPQDTEGSVGQRGSIEDGNIDDRSVDDLVSYIEGGEEEGKGTRKATSKKKKKNNNKEEDDAEDSSMAESIENRAESTHSTHETPQPTDDLRDSQEANVIEEMKAASIEAVRCDCVEGTGRDSEETTRRKLKKEWNLKSKSEQAKDASLAESPENRTKSILPTADFSQEVLANVVGGTEVPTNEGLGHESDGEEAGGAKSKKKNEKKKNRKKEQAKELAETNGKLIGTDH